MAMDLSSMWLSELEMEDPGFMNEYDKMSKPYITVDNLSADYFSSESYTENECFMDGSFQTPIGSEEQIEMELPSYQKVSSINIKSQTPKTVAATTLSSTNTFTISFGDLNPKEDVPPFDDSLGYEITGTGKAQTTARTRVQAQDHVLAERKRREKLNRHLISLSALLPNLKKMDKASVLEDATNYIRELQDRMKELEELLGVRMKDAKESIIALKRSCIRGDDDDESSSNETNSADRETDATCKSSVEIEVRMWGSSVLVRIQSQKNSSLLVKVLSKMQKLGLSIISSSTMPFANTTTIINIVAQIEDDLFMTAMDLVKNLQLAL